MANKITKTIEVFKHPYKWNVQVEFGTFEDMLKNAYCCKRWDGMEISVGGTFNKQMDSTRRSPLVQIAVQVQYDTYRVDNGILKLNGVTDAKGIRTCPWEGTYCYCESLFDDMIAKGLYPVRADWDGKTYIERGKYGKDNRWESWYELTDTYRY